MPQPEDWRFSARSCAFYFQFTDIFPPPRLTLAARDLESRDRGARYIMLDWLIGNCDVFGLPCQNWMWVFGAGLLIYIAVLIVAGRRKTNGHIR